MYIKTTFKNLFKKGENNFVKIILLGVGLAAGLLLIAKIWFEVKYDDCYKDSDRIYTVILDYSQQGKYATSNRTAGGIAPMIKKYSPMVEAATRSTFMADGIKVCQIDESGNFTNDAINVKSVILADTSFFDIFNTNITGPDPHEAMNNAGVLYISRSMASSFDGDPIGKSIASIDDKRIVFTIAGIFDNYPANSTFSKVDMILSLPTIGHFMYDGSDNLLGNERYFSMLKLHKNVNVQNISKDITEMCQKELPLDELKETGTTVNFTVKQISDAYWSDSYVKKINIVLIILAALVIIVSILNYVLVAISSLVKKAKTVAVHKCYGAKTLNIYEMVFSDVAVHLLLSILLAVCLIFAGGDIVKYMTGNNPSVFFNSSSLWLLVSVCIFVFIVCGLLPGAIYAKIPVVVAFRGGNKSYGIWKYFLLFLQLMASAFFITLLAVVVLQYRYMINSDPGYSYKQLAYVNIGGVYKDKRNAIMNEISRLPFVDTLTLSSVLPFEGYSGNNVSIPGDKRELFNIADGYYVGDGFFKTMNIPIIMGHNFSEGSSNLNEVMVSKKFVERIADFYDWQDGLIGKQVIITEHASGDSSLISHTICGVYDDYLIGNFAVGDDRPSVQFYCAPSIGIYDVYFQWLLVKMKEVNGENMGCIDNILEKVSADGDKMRAYSDEFVEQYSDVKRVKSLVWLVGAIVLIITLLGLTGYLQDEINRRRKEVAVRRVNGALPKEMILLFLRKTMTIALPAIIVGCAIARYASGTLIEMFDKKINLSLWIFLLSAACVLVLILIVVVIKTHKAANTNPAENLKSE